MGRNRAEKCAKRYEDGDDRISELTDDILLVILDFLSLKGAARTSVLSSRWRNLWKYTSCLDFDADKALNKIANRFEYIKWVNCVLQSHKASTLKEFRICFDLNRSDQNAITKWLEFAFATQVQRLELDLLEYGVVLSDPRQTYVFPEELLTPSCGVVSKLQPPSDNSFINHLRTPINFKPLTELCLNSANVTGEAIEFFLRNFPLLEKLVVHGTDKISKLEVCGSSLVLKHLEIKYLFGLKSIKVSAPNLTFLIIDVLAELQLENVPMLVCVSVSCGRHSKEYLLPRLACCISQLETLSLDLFSSKWRQFPQLL